MSIPPIPLALENAQTLGRRGQIAWRLVRPLVPRTYRFLYEGQPGLPGLFSFEDRRVLYETIRRVRPRNCFEVGTWMGGGTTLVIAKALRRNGSGRLHTIELDEEILSQAVAGYDRLVPELRQYVEFHQGDYREVLPDVMAQAGGVDFFMLDGAEDSEQTMREFLFFETGSHPGTVLAAHDWNTEKCRELRARLESSDEWAVTHVAGPPKSVGLAIAERVR